MSVKAWAEKIRIPTYGTGKPEKNPMFLEKRVYQGSSGVVYPHPVIEKIGDEKEEREYTALFLENEYLMIMVLPELGGRVQRAYDKVRGRDFVYYNQVIKPALVGLTGPWISGGIEFNWPQHHRPSTFSPVDHTIEEHADGSKTIWVNETELLFRTKGMAGFTMYPGKAYLEIRGRLYNRSAFTQTFLWWANPAVKVNAHYQSVFPPDVYAVFDHGKRDVSDFPIATGTYYKVDYSPGTDISRYDTIPVPTSYMAIRSGYDFMGCYEHDTQAGMLHVADHHLSPGKKQWTWGNGDFGYAWDRNLTDEDGPYIELMTGVFTDNQPDFSWIQPNEGKSFEQYFMPYAEIGAVKNATKEAMVNLEVEGGGLHVKVYATGLYEKAAVILYKDGKEVKCYTRDISPEQVFLAVFEGRGFAEERGGLFTLEGWSVTVADQYGHELVSWKAEGPVEKPVPSPATAARLPEEIGQVEELFLNGLHLEQYRHATYNPMDYYQEALRRSPGDVRCNHAMGLLLLRRGQFAKAEGYFLRAIETLTSRNPNPYDGEPYYNLGWALLLQDKVTDAYAAFYKATWNDAWQHSGFLNLARIAVRQQRYALALEHVEKSLNRNYQSLTARHLKVVILRRLGRLEEAVRFAEASMAMDLFNTGCLAELAGLYVEAGQADEGKGHAAAAAKERFVVLMRNDRNNYFELVLDYAHAGCYEEALALLQGYADESDPMVFYYLGWLAGQAGRRVEAENYFLKASGLKADGCFPNKVEELLILEAALQVNPADAVALYALGNFWYDKRLYGEAISCWERSMNANDRFPTVCRNLSLASYNKLGDKVRAVALLERAFELDRTDARVFMELDQLYRITGRSNGERLRNLEQYPALTEQRDDLVLELITLYNNRGEYERAWKLLSSRLFHPWEGGEGKVVGQFLLCRTGLAQEALQQQDYQQAADLLTALEQYPENLGEGKLYNTPENDIHFLLGCAYEGLGEEGRALACFQRATAGSSEPVQAIYYNDPQPDKIVYQALAWRKLGMPEKAEAIFRRFIRFAEEHQEDRIRIDYFAVSLPDMLVFDVDINRRNRIHCLYLQALGCLGLGDLEAGSALLQEVLVLEPGHQGAIRHERMIPYFMNYAVI